MTGVPCPGCGLTRSVASIAHGQFHHALSMHPFGYAFFALFLFWTAYAVLPASSRARLRAWTLRNDRWLSAVYTTLIAAFLVFGVGRAVYVFAHLHAS